MADVPHTDLELVGLPSLEAGATVLSVEVMLEGGASTATKCDVDVGVRPCQSLFPRLHGNLKNCQKAQRNRSVCDVHPPKAVSSDVKSTEYFKSKQR